MRASTMPDARLGHDRWSRRPYAQDDGRIGHAGRRPRLADIGGDTLKRDGARARFLCAIFALFLGVTSMMTLPFNISARPDLSWNVPFSMIYLLEKLLIALMMDAT